MLPLASFSIERTAPGRPPGLPVMRQRWAELLFLHWCLPPDEITRLLPPGLSLDTFEGKAYVGLVPFTMTGVRPAWSPAVPGLSSFHEINVRTYVHHDGRNPGVWFFSLDAASAAAVRIARAWYRLPYHFARMSLDTGPRPSAGPLEPRRTDHDLEASGASDQPPVARYRSERLWPGPVPASCAISYSVCGTPGAALPGTLEHFLVERYLLYSSGRGKLFTGRVHHPAYPLQRAVVQSFEENLLAAAGFSRPGDDPLVHFAREVDVRIFPLRRL